MKESFWDVLYRRRSIRKYTEDPVPSGVIKEIINAALAAPSAHNSQPWHFTVITNIKEKGELAEQMAELYYSDMILQGINEGESRMAADLSIKKITEAPVVILSCMVNKTLKNEPYTDKGENEHVMAIQSVAVATGNLLLAAAAFGLGSCWYSSPLFCKDLIRKWLGGLDLKDLDSSNLDNLFPQALITLGYPDLSVELKNKAIEDNKVSYVW